MSRRVFRHAVLWGTILFLVGAAGPVPAPGVAGPVPAPGVEARTLRPADLYSLEEIDSPVFSPDGRRVVYERRRIDPEEDRWTGSLEVVDLESGTVRRLVESGEGDGSPRFSPDGSLLGFLSARSDSAQVWVLPTVGGEPWRVTDLPEGVSDFAWAPGSDRIVVVSEDPPGEPPTFDEARSSGNRQRGSEESDERPLPRVITRLQFKEDGTGYIGPRRDHLYVVPVPDDPRETPAEPRQITDGPYDDAAPAWSPDGRWIAFESNRGEHPALDIDTDVWLVPPAGGEPVQVTTDPGGDGGPRWSPNGNWILFLHTPKEPPVYGVPHLSMIRVTGAEDRTPAAGEPVALTRDLDRWIVGEYSWSPDGGAVYARVDDRGAVPVVRVDTGLDASGERVGTSGAVSPVVAGPREVRSVSPAPGGERLAVVLSTPTRPPELYLAPARPLEGVSVPVIDVDDYLQPTPRPADDRLRRLTRANAPIEGLQLAEARPIHYASADGTPVEGWYLLPPGSSGGAESRQGRSSGGGDAAAVEDSRAAASHPLIVRVHGGPVGQYTWGFSFEFQLFAASGYAVLYTNPRGSSGYGLEFSRAIWADWGDLDLQDVEAGVDHLVELGVADPDRVGIGGWSYGGIMTNAAITRSDRFSAAVSGAAEGDAVSAYGTDDIQWWWEAELGLPWENLDAYMRNSPIHDVARVTTPTLFMVGEEDWRQPLSNVEEFYARLRRRMYDGGPETALIIYPGESHGIDRPSFLLDRLRRNVAWYDRHLLDDADADPLYGEDAW